MSYLPLVLGGVIGLALIVASSVVASRLRSERRPGSPDGAAVPGQTGQSAFRLLELTPAHGIYVRDAKVLVTGRFDDPLPQTARLNEKPISLDRVGRFAIELPLVEGENRIAVHAEGEKQAVAMRTVLRDSTAPVVRIESPKPGLVTREKVVRVAGTVVEGLLATLEVNGRAGKVKDGRFDEEVPILVEGDVAIAISCADHAGNAARAEVTVTRDATPPRIRIEPGVHETVTGTAVQRLRGTVEDPRLATARLGGRQILVGRDGGFDQPWKLAEGRNEVLVEAEDAAGNRSSEKVVATLDQRPPAVEIAVRPKDREDPGVILVLRSDEDMAMIEVEGERRAAAGREATVDVPLPSGADRALAVRVFDAVGNAALKSVPVKVLPPTTGWLREPLPAGVRRARERGVYVFEASPVLQIEMVYVPPGDFIMGSEDGQPDARPRHTHLATAGYYIGRHETTWREYLAFCEATRRPAPPEPGFARKDDHPVVNVSWQDARAFCAFARLRLPSEAEWEKAARGTDGRSYPWGSQWERERANFCDAGCPDPLPGKDPAARDGFGYTAPVGSYPGGASPFGARDMAGNVAEWCEDPYEERFYDRYLQGPATPKEREGLRVARGGSWAANFAGCRSFERARFEKSSRSSQLGFRPVKAAD